MIASAGSLGVDLSPGQSDQLCRYEALLREWSERVRLISRGDTEHLRERHTLDSLACLPLLPDGPLLDLGTGGGLPGVPIAICDPDRTVVLVDSTRMKCLFLRQVVSEIALSNTTVEHARVEELTATYSVVTARAVADLKKLWELSRDRLSPGGELVAYKGPKESEQWEKAREWKGVDAVEVVVVKQGVLPRDRAFVRLVKSGL